MVAAGSQGVQQVCSNIGACKPMGMVASTLQEKTECGACRAVAMDIEYLLDRERDYKDKKRMKALVGTICDDLGMRHPQSDKAFIEVGRSRATTAALPSVDRAVLLWFHRTTAMKSWRRLASVSCGCGPGGTVASCSLPWPCLRRCAGTCRQYCRDVQAAQGHGDQHVQVDADMGRQDVL